MEKAKEVKGGVVMAGDGRHDSMGTLLSSVLIQCSVVPWPKSYTLILCRYCKNTKHLFLFECLHA